MLYSEYRIDIGLMLYSEYRIDIGLMLYSECSRMFFSAIQKLYSECSRMFFFQSLQFFKALLSISTAK
jgi:hypothetical protein